MRDLRKRQILIGRNSIPYYDENGSEGGDVVRTANAFPNTKKYCMLVF